MFFRGPSCILIFSLIISIPLFSQNNYKGFIYDKKNKDPLIGSNIYIPISGKGTVTDINGYFEFFSSEKSIEIEITFIGYQKKIIKIKANETNKIFLLEDKLILSEITVVDSRLTEKQKQSPITVESMDIIAIKETPAASFYEGLGALKGVDLTSASLGFKIINTRGFNSTSPVRSLQLIDGVDNQSPGLNFSLGNFLGSPELDLKKVDIVVGASSALYGPNAFNGVISMETKDPFQFPGISTQFKSGERNLTEFSLRFADVIKNKQGEDKFGFKYNFYRMSAYDWVANNYDQAFGSPSNELNLGGYDAVNRYGDEEYSTAWNFSLAPGLGRYHRSSYAERDLVDYNTENYKMNAAFHYKFNEENQLIYSTNYGNGTTVYQGDNRFSLKDIQFFQNRIEFKHKDNFFIRFYETHEDAGNSYDAVATARALQELHLSKKQFSEEYYGYWISDIMPQILEIPGWIDVFDIQLYETDPVTGEVLFDENGIPVGIPNAYQNWYEQMTEVVNSNNELFQQFHEETQNHVDNTIGIFGNSFLQPGTEEFQEEFNSITSKTRFDENGNLLNGTKFYDKSKLFHAQTEYKFDIGKNKITIGASGRIYNPDSNGSIFNDGYIQKYKNIYLYDENNNPVIEIDSSLVNVGNAIFPIYETVYDTTHLFSVDTTVKKLNIVNKEFGLYSGLERKLLGETLKFSATLRLDKNQNFNYLISPATSFVYTPNENDVIRVSLSSAIRNPTLTDQYLNYDAGVGILLGNLNGFGYNEYFAEVDSLEQYFIGGLVNPKPLIGGMIKVKPIKPEKVKTLELGYRSTLFNKLYVDISTYFSIYDDFIGYQEGVSFRFLGTRVATEQDVNDGWASEIGDTIDDYNNLLYPSIQGYRLAANASSRVTTKGFSLGFNYYMNGTLTINGNYSYNKLNKQGTDDPIIPAYNTPENKFNLGLNLRDLNIFNSPGWNMSLNYKWIQSFLFEGSLQFTGRVPKYSLLDAQINKDITSLNAILKLGCSNLLNNLTFQVYGGPRVGRMLYSSIQFNL